VSPNTAFAHHPRTSAQRHTMGCCTSVPCEPSPALLSPTAAQPLKSPSTHTTTQQVTPSTQEENEQSPEIHNVLVLQLGVLDGEHNEDVTRKMETWKALWEMDYGYDVMESIVGRCEDIVTRLEQHREQLLDADGQLRYDGLILVICAGHGDGRAIVPSNYDPRGNPRTVKHSALHATVNGLWNPKATRIPRLFIIDCSQRVELERVQSVTELKPAERDLGGGGGNVHRDNLLYTISVMNCSQGLQKAFKDNITQQQRLLFVQIQAREQRTDRENQRNFAEGDVAVPAKVFAPKSRHG